MPRIDVYYLSGMGQRRPDMPGPDDRFAYRMPGDDPTLDCDAIVVWDDVLNHLDTTGDLADFVQRINQVGKPVFVYSDSDHGPPANLPQDWIHRPRGRLTDGVVRQAIRVRTQTSVHAPLATGVFGHIVKPLALDGGDSEAHIVKPVLPASFNSISVSIDNQIDKLRAYISPTDQPPSVLEMTLVKLRNTCDATTIPAEVDAAKLPRRAVRAAAEWLASLCLKHRSGEVIEQSAGRELSASDLEELDEAPHMAALACSIGLFSVLTGIDETFDEPRLIQFHGEWVLDEAELTQLGLTVNGWIELMELFTTAAGGQLEIVQDSAGFALQF